MKAVAARTPRLLVACAALAWQPAHAAVEDAERARIADERRVILARYAEEERACRDRFVVTACVDDVRLRQRAALQPLRERELRLDDADRRQRAVERRAELEAKRSAAAQAPASAPAPELRLRKPTLAPTAAAPRPPPREDEAAARAAEAAARVQAADRRRAEMQESQARVTRRLAERAAKGQPDPSPPAASASKR